MSVNTTASLEQRSNVQIIAWALVSLVTLLGIYVWGKGIGWQLSSISAYSLFPVLGLVAFSIMWSHYVVSAIRTFVNPAIDLHDFFKWTGYAVLVLILLHPGILIYQRFRDGFGLPPGSYQSYVAPGMAWLTLLGSVSLLAFLAFELKRWFDKKSWWKYVLYLNEAAMLAIFYHGLQLGTQTHIAWFRNIWWFYGISLIAVLIYSHIVRIQQRSSSD